MAVSRETLQQSSPFIHSDGKNHIRSFDTHPNLLIRVNQKVGTDENVIDNYTNEQRVLLDDIKSHGIHVPTYFATKGSLYSYDTKSSYTYAAHTFIRRVEVMDIEDIPVGSQEEHLMIREVRETYSKLSSYCLDAFNQNKPVLSDIFTLDQWVYGKTTYDQTNKLYLVDIQNLTTTLPKQGHLSNLETFADETKQKLSIDVTDLANITRINFEC